MFETLLSAIEHSTWGMTARSSPWLYPLANLSHVLGAALLVGAITVYDLAVLARASTFSQGWLAIGVALFGFVLIVAGGSVLFAAEATALGRNPVFLVKMAILAVALVNVLANHLLRAQGRVWQAPASAAVSLVAWISVLLAGRLIAYV
ncbi:MAG: hypothetical protein ABWZ27_06210 [Aestuariivirgaceae bacterium]